MATLSKSKSIRSKISYITNNHGKKTAIVINLQDKRTERIVEDILDNFDIISRAGETTRPFEDIDKEILASFQIK
jgi:hypothetical protein